MLKVNAAIAILLASITFSSSPANATSCSALPYTFANGTTADASQMMADLNYLAGCSASTSAAPTTTVESSGSGTYTVPAGVKWLRVRMLGGGGGGGSSGHSGAGGITGGIGGNTTFGTSLLVANGGGGGGAVGQSAFGGTGGAASISSPAVGIALSGAYGGGTSQNNTGFILAGACGGSTSLGGANCSSPNANNGANGNAGTGTGGQGGGQAALNSAYNAGGGGAGGYIEATISSPSTTYAYAVGTAGVGSTGTGDFAGGNGGSGIIIIEEHYD